MRTVLRIKSNHLYVPYEMQDRFQKLIDLLLNENMSEEEINATMQMIGTEFPNTKNWLKWHVDNGRGPLIFPSLSKEFISGFGRDTNGQEGTGGWIKRSCATKHPNLVQGLEHLAIIGRVIENDLANEYEGSATRYGAYTNPVERREVAKLKRKKKHSINDNDGRPPDTTRHAPNKTEYGVNGLDLRHCIPWSFNTLTPTKPYPIGLSVAQGSAMGPQPTCKYCRTCIMRSQWRAIKKVKRNGNGLGYDVSQYHLRCVKKVLSEKELEQLLAIIRSLDVDPDVGSRSAMIRQIDGDSKKTAWDYILEND
jgi:hypothetical protein